MLASRTEIRNETAGARSARDLQACPKYAKLMRNSGKDDTEFIKMPCVLHIAQPELLPSSPRSKPMSVMSGRTSAPFNDARSDHSSKQACDIPYTWCPGLSPTCLPRKANCNALKMPLHRHEIVQAALTLAGLRAIPHLAHPFN